MFLRTLATQAARPPLVVVCSVGNPEGTYALTRHSVGHLVVASLASRYFGTTEFTANGRGVEYMVHPSQPQLCLLRTTGYMNECGPPIARMWRQIQDAAKAPARLVVVHDEVEREVGTVQVRKAGTSARGHNGLRLLDSCIKGGYSKIGVGVGKLEPVRDHVLSRFPRSELAVVQGEVADKVWEIVEQMKRGGA